jgi:hypothetical protein
MYGALWKSSPLPIIVLVGPSTNGSFPAGEDETAAAQLQFSTIAEALIDHSYSLYCRLYKKGKKVSLQKNLAASLHSHLWT